MTDVVTPQANPTGQVAHHLPVGDAAPVIDGEFEVIEEAMPEPGSRHERTVSAERHHVPRATGTPFEQRRAAGHGNRFELP